VKSIRWFLLVALFRAANFAQGQSSDPTVLRVRALDSHTHQPLKNLPIQLTFTDMNGEWISNGQMTKSQTATDGVATFSVAQALPPRAGIFVRFGFLCVSRSTEF
jgi:hypothetical protein